MGQKLGDSRSEGPRTLYFFMQAYQALRSRLEVALAAHGLTPIQYTVLTVVRSRAGLSSADLSRWFYVTPQTMNGLIALLERDELISRSADPDNRRILRLALTSKGRALLARADPSVDAVEEDAFSYLSADERVQMRALVRTLSRNLRDRG